MNSMNGLVYSNGYTPMTHSRTTVTIAVLQCVKNHDAQYMFAEHPIISMPSRSGAPSPPPPTS